MGIQQKDAIIIMLSILSLVLLALAKEEVSGEGQGAIIESVRTLGEVEKMRSAGGSGFLMLAVDADQRLRYDRVVQRKSATDMITFDEFVEQEAREMNNANDPAKQNLAGCIASSDYRIMNGGTLEELHAEVDRILESRSS